MSHSLFCLVMAGGKGTRFWPESTSKRPKQYLSLVSDESLLTETLKRFEGIVQKEHRYIVTVKEQEELARQSAQELIDDGGLIFEPSGRNTAPCILLSLAALRDKGARDDDIVAIVPSDHVILNSEGFQKTIIKSAEVASKERAIVTIGIKPHFPHTGYGYIQRGPDLGDQVYQVLQFKEKPDFDTAKGYLASGEYLWNAGMFMGSMKVLEEEFAKHSPETFEHYESVKNGLHEFEKLAEAYGAIPANSIDYAIMEKSERVMVVPADFDWNDLGSWDALEAVIEHQAGNTLARTKGHHVESSSGNIVYAPNQYVALINVHDLIVVSNEKALVVLPKSDSQKVKQVVEALKGTERADDLL